MELIQITDTSQIVSGSFLFYIDNKNKITFWTLVLFKTSEKQIELWEDGSIFRDHTQYDNINVPIICNNLFMLKL